MAKTPLSEFLEEQKPLLKEVINDLTGEYDYISVLGTDTRGLGYMLSSRDVKMEDSFWSERGFVFRIQQHGRITEYALNDLPGGARELEKNIRDTVESAWAEDEPSVTHALLRDESAAGTFQGDVEQDPISADPQEIFDRLASLKDQVMGLSSSVVNVRIMYTGVRVSKIFLSARKDLTQSYTWSQAYLVPFVKVGEEVICSPDITGLIAHEAFGHGVETDMFVKGRALAKDFIGKKVASPIVTMKDGAGSATQVASYYFDDEGTIGQDTLIIENGILKSGISDILSANALKIRATGNGRRQSFANKAYARMTNTLFEPGENTLEEMVASISHGYLIDHTHSGMEDPKNWGIQAVALIGKEIRDGKFTGKISSPVIMTGYVPEVLSNITMISRKVELFGTGACGKGHKELAKVSAGGPYIKTKMRLG
jgi:TldD protein